MWVASDSPIVSFKQTYLNRIRFRFDHEELALGNYRFSKPIDYDYIEKEIIGLLEHKAIEKRNALSSVAGKRIRFTTPDQRLRQLFSAVFHLKTDADFKVSSPTGFEPIPIPITIHDSKQRMAVSCIFFIILTVSLSYRVRYYYTSAFIGLLFSYLVYLFYSL